MVGEFIRWKSKGYGIKLKKPTAIKQAVGQPVKKEDLVDMRTPQEILERMAQGSTVYDIVASDDESGKEKFPTWTLQQEKALRAKHAQAELQRELSRRADEGRRQQEHQKMLEQEDADDNYVPRKSLPQIAEAKRAQKLLPSGAPQGLHPRDEWKKQHPPEVYTLTQIIQLVREEEIRLGELAKTNKFIAATMSDLLKMYSQSLLCQGIKDENGEIVV